MRLANQLGTSFHAGEGGVNGVVAIKPYDHSLNHRGQLLTAPCKYAASPPCHRPPLGRLRRRTPSGGTYIIPWCCGQLRQCASACAQQALQWPARPRKQNPRLANRPCIGWYKTFRDSSRAGGSVTAALHSWHGGCLECPGAIHGTPNHYSTGPSIAPCHATGQLTAKSGLLVKAALMAHH